MLSTLPTIVERIRTSKLTALRASKRAPTLHECVGFITRRRPRPARHHHQADERPRGRGGEKCVSCREMCRNRAIVSEVRNA